MLYPPGPPKRFDECIPFPERGELTKLPFLG